MFLESFGKTILSIMKLIHKVIRNVKFSMSKLRKVEKFAENNSMSIIVYLIDSISGVYKERCITFNSHE